MPPESYAAKVTRLRREIIEVRDRAHKLEAELANVGNARGLKAAEAMGRAVIDLGQAASRIR